MGILEEASEIIITVMQLSKEKNFDLDKIEENKSGFLKIWNEAIRRYEFKKENLEESELCKECERHKQNLDRLEKFIQLKKKESEADESIVKKGYVVGLETAAAIMK